MKLLSDILLLLAFCYLENIFNNETSRSVVTVHDHQHDINGGEKTIAIIIKISPQNNPISNFSGCIMHHVGGSGPGHSCCDCGVQSCSVCTDRQVVTQQVTPDTPVMSADDSQHLILSPLGLVGHSRTEVLQSCKLKDFLSSDRTLTADMTCHSERNVPRSPDPAELSQN